MTNRRLRYFWYEFRKGLNTFFDITITAIGLWTIFYGVLLLYEYLVTGIWGIASVDTVTMAIAIGGAVLIGLGTLYALIYALVRVVQYDPRKDVIVDKRGISSTPSLNIEINSKDVRRMDSNKITHFFEGVKQILIEYRETIGEVRKHEQEIIKGQSTTSIRSKEAKRKRRTQHKKT